MKLGGRISPSVWTKCAPERSILPLGTVRYFPQTNLSFSMVLRKSNTNVLQSVTGKKIERMCLQISKNVLSDNRYRKGCVFKPDFVLGGTDSGGGRLSSKFLKILWSFPSTCGVEQSGVLWGVCVLYYHSKMDDLRKRVLLF